jgi:hypothetical protein
MRCSQLRRGTIVLERTHCDNVNTQPALLSSYARRARAVKRGASVQQTILADASGDREEGQAATAVRMSQSHRQSSKSDCVLMTALLSGNVWYA